jgi:signal transduction histidine kinase
LVLQLFYRQRMRNKIQMAAQTEEVNRQRTLELIREHELMTIKANLEGRENERLRISQELHDGVAGSLAGIKLQTRKVADEHNLKELNLIMQNIDSVYDEVRSLSHNLSPLKVLNTAFIDLLKNQLKLAGEQGSFTWDFICYPEVTLNQLPDTIKIEVYRILQELLANIIRHAHPKTVEVQFTLNDESINLMVEDSGKGFDHHRVAPGVGLSSIRNRVSSLEGKLHIESAIGRGTIINIDIPLQHISSTSRL